MIILPFTPYPFRFQDREKGRYIYDIIRKKYILLTPEEWVRQNLLHYFIRQQGYPKGLISVEKEIRVNNLKKRYDLVIFNKAMHPWMLVECKEPQVPITEQTLRQLLRYHQTLQCPFWMLSNGKEHYCGQVSQGKITWLQELPAYEW